MNKSAEPSTTSSRSFTCCGILLAAGQGKRFDPSGVQHKLLQQLPSQQTVVATSAANLARVLPNGVVVLGGATSSVSVEIAKQLAHLPLSLSHCEQAQLGMSASLVHGLLQMPGNCDAVVIAFADMPFVQEASLRAIVHQLGLGAGIVVPSFGGRRGHPVGFSKQHFPALLQLQGDKGARHLLEQFPVIELALDDAGVLQDIDVPADMPSCDKSA